MDWIRTAERGRDRRGSETTNISGTVEEQFMAVSTVTPPLQRPADTRMFSHRSWLYIHGRDDTDPLSTST